MPFKWYPGTRVLDQAFLWRLVDLTEADGRPIDRVIATKFPAYCVRHPNKVAWVLHQFRQAYDYDRTELGQFSESPEDRATRAADRAARRCRAGRGAPGVRDLAERRRASTALQRDRRGGAAASATGARVSLRGAGRVRPLRQPARPRQANRPADRRRRSRAGAAGRDRRRGARPGAPRAVGRPPERPGRVRRPRRRRPPRRSLRALPRRLLRTHRRGLRDGPLRGVPLGQAGLDDERRRRPARGRPRPQDRPRRLAAGGRARQACAYLAGHVEEAKAWGRAGKLVAERVTWDACIDALLA